RVPRRGLARLSALGDQDPTRPDEHPLPAPHLDVEHLAAPEEDRGRAGRFAALAALDAHVGARGRGEARVRGDGLEELRQALGPHLDSAGEQHEERQRDVALADPARYTHRGGKSRSIARCQARRTMEANRKPGLRGALARALVALVVIETGWLCYPAVRVRLLAFEETPARRGQRLAGELGCFSCHGPGGGGGTKNPGSEDGTVPAFTERTQMMYVKTTDDLREYVLDGAPRRKRDDPDYRAKMEK